MTITESVKKNVNILYELKNTYKKDNYYCFEMFTNGNAIFYNAQNNSCFYGYKTLYEYSKVFPKAKIFETMFFHYKGRIISAGLAAVQSVEMGENMQNMLKKEYEKDRKNLTFLFSSNKKQIETIYQLKISIKGAKPPIWRRVLVDEEITFIELHDIIQTIFNWEDYHMYEFFAKNANYTTSEFLEENDFFGGKQTYNVSKFKINSELQSSKDKIKYIYDFGDDWEHEIILEKILTYDEKIQYPICTAGKRNGPMEDCGGIYNFNEIVNSIENPTAENQYVLGEDGENYYDEDFNPKEFDIELINKMLQTEE